MILFSGFTPTLCCFGGLAKSFNGITSFLTALDWYDFILSIGLGVQKLGFHFTIR